MLGALPTMHVRPPRYLYGVHHHGIDAAYLLLNGVRTCTRVRLGISPIPGEMSPGCIVLGSGAAFGIATQPVLSAIALCGTFNAHCGAGVTIHTLIYWFLWFLDIMSTVYYMYITFICFLMDEACYCVAPLVWGCPMTTGRTRCPMTI